MQKSTINKRTLQTIVLPALTVLALAGAYALNARKDTLKFLVPPNSAEKTMPEIKGFGKWVTINYEPSEKDHLILRMGQSFRPIKVLQVENNNLNYQLKNDNASPEIYSIERGSDHYKIVFVIPGTARNDQQKGAGNVIQLASALASYYNTPIELIVRDLAQTTSWTFKEKNPVESISTELSNSKLSLQYLNTQVIRLSER